MWNYVSIVEHTIYYKCVINSVYVVIVQSKCIKGKYM